MAINVTVLLFNLPKPWSEEMYVHLARKIKRKFENQTRKRDWDEQSGAWRGKRGGLM
jgi:hypothetical protein